MVINFFLKKANMNNDWSFTHNIALQGLQLTENMYYGATYTYVGIDGLFDYCLATQKPTQ